MTNYTIDNCVDDYDLVNMVMAKYMYMLITIVDLYQKKICLNPYNRLNNNLNAK